MAVFRGLAELAEGLPCERSVECAQGLACVERVCSGDLTGIAGMVPEEAGVDAATVEDTSVPMDTSMPADAEPVDPDAMP